MAVLSAWASSFMLGADARVSWSRCTTSMKATLLYRTILQKLAGHCSSLAGVGQSQPNCLGHQLMIRPACPFPAPVHVVVAAAHRPSKAAVHQHVVLDMRLSPHREVVPARCCRTLMRGW
eukprot:350636-Chlamydomonas_euryale.AAC.3